MSIVERAQEIVEDLGPILDMLRGTAPEQWQCDVVRSQDGSRNCFFGHLHRWAIDSAEQHVGEGIEPEKWASRIWDAFEETWATTYMVYPVNDGQHPGYQQPEARDRVIAYLEALQRGDERTTQQIMQDAYEADLES